jgi:hypothetical protein
MSFQCGRPDLGDKLICLCAAWLFARNTRRNLIVDWRYSHYLKKPINLFSLCFEHEGCLAGVPFKADDNIAKNLPRPRFPGLQMPSAHSTMNI